MHTMQLRKLEPNRLFLIGVFLFAAPVAESKWFHPLIESTHSARHIRSPALLQSSPNGLINDPACPEIRTLCNKLPNPSQADDLSVLECVQTLQADQIEKLTSECHAVIWQHITDLLDDKNIRKLTLKSCGEDVDKLECRSSGEPGQLLACLLDHQPQGPATECRKLIEQLESIAFSDYRLVGAFIRDCNQDITQLECGRITSNRNELSQGKTLQCLQEHVEKLRPKCRKGVMHLSQLESENIKYDRQLFLACISDSNRLCPEARPGSGAVFKCLMRNRNDALISPKCVDQLSRRYKLMSHDYKIGGLARACKEDIRVYKCRKGVADDKEVRLAQILLCLESVQKNNSKIAAECLVEMADHRRLIMEDYQLSPELFSSCHDDMNRFCGDLPTSGKTIHCLMEHARPSGKTKADQRVKPECLRALEQLVKVADVGEDWRVDPVLRRACKPVVDVACQDADGGDARVMNCLMDHLGTNFMTRDCESAVLLIQYFVARDFKLDPQLYRKCREDAVRVCHAKKTWTEMENVDSAQMDPERGPLVLSCLHRNALHGAGDKRLKPECVEEVRRVMRQRAVSVDLIPEVEEDCLDDLSAFCFDKTEKGQEMQCLQDNLERLTEACHSAVSVYTEDEAGHFELNPVIAKVCKPAMEKHCGEILRSGRDEGDMMECLIGHKNDPDLRADAKCRAAIEHFQIISLKDFRFTSKFKEACRPYVTRYCPNSTTKYDVVSCLSGVMRDNIVNEERHQLPKECRQQVRSQLFQQRENIDFDPHLKRDCAAEIKDLCKDVQHGSGQVLECLVTNSAKLGPQCRRSIFSVKKSELLDSTTDYALMTACKPMLEQFCAKVEDQAVLECLKKHKDEDAFDRKCHLVVVNRLIIQNQDYRFNPKLQEACSRNIADHCTAIVADEKEHALNGKVLDCLKGKFREGKLTNKCKKEVTTILQEQALNYKLNPLLQELCAKEIKVLCQQNEDSDEDHGEVQECLKQAFLERRIVTKECQVEVATLIQESKADIHVDPLLQRACTIDLLKYCSKVVSGDGRQLKCLQVIMNDSSNKLEDDCRTMLTQRAEMFSNSAALASVSDLYEQMVMSPAKRSFVVLILSVCGMVFIFGMVCGRVNRSQAMKNK